MSYDVTKVVTGRTADGRSVFAEQGPVTLNPVLGLELLTIWGTEDGTAVVGAGDDNPAPVTAPFFPSAGGSRFLVFRVHPESAAAADVDPAEAAAAAERVAPGLIGFFEPDTPGMHTTDTIDYGICVDGEVYLELDDGVEVLITPGTCVVQRGTRHAWRNRSDRPCTIVGVIVGAERK